MPKPEETTDETPRNLAAAQEVPAQTMGELRLVYAVLDAIQGQAILIIRGPKETVQAMAPMFSRRLTVVARDGGLWISPAAPPEAPGPQKKE